MQPARLDVCMYVLLKITNTDYSVIFASFRASASIMSQLFPKLLRENYVKKKKKGKKDEVIKLKVNNNSYEHDETKRNMRKRGEKYEKKEEKKLLMIVDATI